MKRVEEILIQCIDDIKTGRASLEDCLNRYPDVRHELEPLLRVALSVKAPADIKPSDAFRVRARANLMKHIHASQAKRKAPQAGFGYGWFTGWARAVAVVGALILTISAAGAGTAYASQSSLPGDTLYAVKLATEQVQRIITLDDAAEVDLELEFASTRLDELEELVNMSPARTAMTRNSHNRVLTMSIINIPLDKTEKAYIPHSDRIAMAIEGYERNLNLAITRAGRVGAGETPLEKVALAVLDHLDKIDNIEDEASGEERNTVSNTKDVAINGNIKTLQNLAKIDPVRATEINLEAIQGRLERAENQVSRGDEKGLEDALQEYEELRKFGEEISRIARGLGKDEARIEELVAEATSKHLEILAEVYEEVPAQAKPAIEKAMQESMKGYERATEALEKTGAADNITERPELPSPVPQKIRDSLGPSLHSDEAGASDNVTEQPPLPSQVPEDVRDGSTPSPPVDIPGQVPGR